MACYEALIEAGDELGETYVVEVCRQNCGTRNRWPADCTSSCRRLFASIAAEAAEHAGT
jgi:hypothetical protein